MLTALGYLCQWWGGLDNVESQILKGVRLKSYVSKYIIWEAQSGIGTYVN